MFEETEALLRRLGPAEPDEGSIAHCVVELGDSDQRLVETEVTYHYRGNQIIDALVALAWVLTGEPIINLPEDDFKYL